MTKNFFTALGIISIGLLMAILIIQTLAGCGIDPNYCVTLEEFSNG